MDNENEPSGSSVQVYNAELPTFLDDGKTINLKKVALSLSRHVEAAVQALVKLIENEKVEDKIKMQAATALLELRIKVGKEISADQVQRLIAEFKLNPTGRKQLQTADDNSRPLVDFSTVQAVD